MPDSKETLDKLVNNLLDLAPKDFDLNEFSSERGFENFSSFVKGLNVGYHRSTELSPEVIQMRGDFLDYVTKNIVVKYVEKYGAITEKELLKGLIQFVNKTSNNNYSELVEGHNLFIKQTKPFNMNLKSKIKEFGLRSEGVYSFMTDKDNYEYVFKNASQKNIYFKDAERAKKYFEANLITKKP